jgi:ParB/RepB/Spo0J family partition protein
MKGAGFQKSEGADKSPSDVNYNSDTLQTALLSELSDNNNGDRLLSVDPSCVQPDPDQPRKHFDKAGLEDLAKNIEANGQLQPIVASDLGGGKYQIIAGERRWRAATLAGINIQIIIKKGIQGDDVFIAQLMENIKRENMTIEETAAGYNKAMKMILDKTPDMKVLDASTRIGLKKTEYYRWVSVHKAFSNDEGITKQLAGFTDDITVIDSAVKLEEKDPKAVSRIVKALHKKTEDGEGIINIRKMVKEAHEKIDNKDTKKAVVAKAPFKLENSEKINGLYFLTLSNGKSNIDLELNEAELENLIGLTDKSDAEEAICEE